MKLAITSKGQEITSLIDPRLGRAECFIIFDTETGEYTAIDNSQNLAATHGAGVQTAKILVDQGVEAVITGNAGPNALRSLKAAGVKVFLGKEGTVETNLDSFKSGELEQAS